MWTPVFAVFLLVVFAFGLLGLEAARVGLAPFVVAYVLTRRAMREPPLDRTSYLELERRLDADMTRIGRRNAVGVIAMGVLGVVELLVIAFTTRARES